MQNPFSGEKPLTKAGSGSVASKQKDAERKREQLEEARLRYNTIRYYEKHCTDLSWREAADVIEKAVEEGDLDGKAYSYSQLFKRYQKVEEMRKRGESIGVIDFVTKDTGGRKKKPIDEPVKEWLERQVVQGVIRSGTRLYENAVEFAEANDHAPPTRWQVRRFLRDMDPVEVVGGRYGRRAALVDAMPKSTLPVERPHQCWLLDETRAPVFIRALDPDTREWHPTDTWVILLIDAYSRAILSYWVLDPFKRGTGPSYSSDDVLGTFLGAAFPELAPEVTQSLAGYLPDELRWDKHGTHEKLADSIRELGIHVLKPVGESPYRQGRVERLNGTIKGLCETIRGANHAYQPVHPSTMKESPKRTRTRASGGQWRQKARRKISVHDLLTIDEFREEVAERVREYNDHPHSMLDGMSPAVAYLRKLDDAKSRPGRDALLLMNDQMLTCTKAGIDHQVNGVRRVFDPESVELEIGVGDQLHCFSDPLQRRLLVFNHDDRRIRALMTKEDSAAVNDYVGTIRDQKRRAKEASELGARARRDALEGEIGEEGIARAEEEEAQLEEEEFPERQVGAVAQKRREIEEYQRELIEEREALEEKHEQRRRKRGMAGDPRDQLRRSS